jgi:hypothetical protein
MKRLCHALEHKTVETRWHRTGFKFLWNGMEWHGYRPLRADSELHDSKTVTVQKDVEDLGGGGATEVLYWGPANRFQI